MPRSETWTKEQYLNWLAARGPVGSWEYSACIAADRHIKETTLTIFEEKAKIIPEPYRKFLVNMVRYEFGTGEVDELLIALNCYPDYMERP